MSAMLQDVPEVQQAYAEYKRFSADPVMREKARARERFLIDQKLDRAEAREEGREEGRVEGRVEGREEKARETAKILSSMGLSSSDIAQATGLPLSEIERL